MSARTEHRVTGFFTGRAPSGQGGLEENQKKPRVTVLTQLVHETRRSFFPSGPRIPSRAGIKKKMKFEAPQRPIDLMPGHHVEA